MLLRPNVLRGVADAACMEASRAELCGIYLERIDGEHSQATATNGKMLISSSWREEDNAEFPLGAATVKEGFTAILPLEAALGVVKAMPTARRAGPKPILMRAALDENAANGVLPVIVTDLETTRRLEPHVIDGAYPNYRNAMPTKKPKFTMTMNPALLRDLCAALCRIHPGKPARGKVPATGPDCATIEFHASDRPLVFRLASKDGIETIALAMPIVFNEPAISAATGAQ